MGIYAHRDSLITDINVSDCKIILNEPESALYIFNGVRVCVGACVRACVCVCVCVRVCVLLLLFSY